MLAAAACPLSKSLFCLEAFGPELPLPACLAAWPGWIPAGRPRAARVLSPGSGDASMPRRRQPCPQLGRAEDLGQCGSGPRPGALAFLGSGRHAMCFRRLVCSVISGWLPSLAAKDSDSPWRWRGGVLPFQAGTAGQGQGAQQPTGAHKVPQSVGRGAAEGGPDFGVPVGRDRRLSDPASQPGCSAQPSPLPAAVSPRPTRGGGAACTPSFPSGLVSVSAVSKHPGTFAGMSLEIFTPCLYSKDGLQTRR